MFDISNKRRVCFNIKYSIYDSLSSLGELRDDGTEEKREESRRMRIISDTPETPRLVRRSYYTEEKKEEPRRIHIVPNTTQIPTSNENQKSSSRSTRSPYRITFLNDVFITRDEAIRRYRKSAESKIGRAITFVVKREESHNMRITSSQMVIPSRRMFMGRPLSSLTPSEIEFFREKSKREQTTLYERKVNEIIASIPDHFSNIEKLKAVFDWFVKNTTYYQDYPRGVGLRTTCEYQEWMSYPPEISCLDYNTKEGAILTGCSVCGGLSDAFQDVVNRLGISCDCVHNDIHAWNVVYKEDREYYIDIAQAVPYKNKATGTITPRFSTNLNFLVTIEELNRGPYPHNNGRIDETKTKYVR